MADIRAFGALPPATAAPRRTKKGLLPCSSKEVILPCRPLGRAPIRTCNKGARR